MDLREFAVGRLLGANRCQGGPMEPGALQQGPALQLQLVDHLKACIYQVRNAPVLFSPFSVVLDSCASS